MFNGLWIMLLGFECTVYKNYVGINKCLFMELVGCDIGSNTCISVIKYEIMDF